MNNNRKEYTILWNIRNYSHCWHKNGEPLSSPNFTGDGLEGTVWHISVFPRGEEAIAKSNISLFLYRNAVDDGPENFPLKGELSILAADGSSLHSRNIEKITKRGNGRGYHKFVERNDVYLRRKTAYLPDDTLRVRCKIWKGEGNIEKVEQITARTRIGIEKISFLHIIENFSALKPSQKKTIQIKPVSKERLALSNSVYLSDDSLCDEKIIVEIASSNPNRILSKCIVCLINQSGIVVKCGEADSRPDDTRKDISKVPLSLTRKTILNEKCEYLPDDKISLYCECTFSTGVEYEKIERIVHEIPFEVSNQISKIDHDEDLCAKKLSECRSALDDLKDLYQNQFLTDVEIKTNTNSFHAHKNVLCARSSVFKAMLSNNMKEKNADSIEIDDLENHTIEQLLLFLYSDKLENLQWESAVNLYYAADKYAIEKLILLCSSFLVQNITIFSASELLLLADTHNDSYLKNAAEDFILKHDEEIFGSDEWKNLEKTNPQLVIKTMHAIYKKKM